MAKQAATFDLTLSPRNSGVPAYRWLYAALRSEILEGRLRPGSRLPATRDLSRQYGLSRGTIVNAFDQLKSEGYVEGNVGSGTYVSRVLPNEFARGCAAVDCQTNSSAPTATPGLRLRPPREPVPQSRNPAHPRFPGEPPGARLVSSHVMGAGRGPPPATRLHPSSSRLRSHGI